MNGLQKLVILFVNNNATLLVIFASTLFTSYTSYKYYGMNKCVK